MADSKRKTLHEDRFIRIIWDEETRVLESIQLSQMSSLEYRATLERLLAFIREKRARKYLADMNNAGTISPEDLWWAEADWFPRAVKAGVKFIAMVMPKSLAGHLAFDKAADKADTQAQGVVRGIFKDVQSARDWIMKQ